MTMAQDNMFRAYDIRGVYGKELTPEFAERLGKAIGTFFGQGKAIAVARDTRESGKVLKESLVRGLTSVGCDVVDFELFPTPSTALVVIRRHLGGAVVVSASHNTAEWNGFIPINSDGLICSEGFGMERDQGVILDAGLRPAREGGEGLDPRCHPGLHGHHPESRRRHQEVPRRAGRPRGSHLPGTGLRPSPGSVAR